MSRKLMVLRSQAWILLFVLCGSSVFSTQSRAQDQSNNQWGNWRGPNFTGAVDDATPPLEWDAEKNIRWKTPIPGAGSGSPIVWNDQVILVSAVPTDRVGEPDLEDVPPGPDAAGVAGIMRSRMNNPLPKNIYEFTVFSVDRNSGQTQWKTVVHEAVPHEGGHTTNTFASGSPVTNGKHIFVSFGSYGVHCLDMQGNKVWSQDLGKMTTRNGFGEASTPALYKDTLIVPWDQDGYQDKNGNGQREDDELLSSIAALNAKTGEIKWRTPRPTEKTTWATPLVLSFGGKAQVITNGTRVRSYALEDGSLLWECGGQVTNPIPSPLPFESNVICMTGYRGNAVYSTALDSQGNIDGTDKIRWSRNDTAPYVSSACLYRGRIYLTKSRDGIMQVIDAETGEVVIPETRLPGVNSMYASQVAANGHVYFTGREGTTCVIQADDKFKVLSVNRLGEPVDASPALSGSDLFIRAATHLYCISSDS